MKITSIALQTHDKNRVNISVDGKYRFSLSVFQIFDLGLKVGNEYDETELQSFESESLFGKLYGRALEYCLMRPHSAHEVSDYLYRKTRSKRDKNGELQPGMPAVMTKRVFDALVDKGYIDDQKFAQYWVDNRSLTKGLSRRKLIEELRSKGVDSGNIDQALGNTVRSDNEEIQKIILKKRRQYPDYKKLMAYLARLGFNYDDIKQAIDTEEE